MTAKRSAMDRIVPSASYDIRVDGFDVERTSWGPRGNRKILYDLVISEGRYREMRLRRHWVIEHYLHDLDARFYLACGMPAELWDPDRWPPDTMLTFDYQLPVGRTSVGDSSAIFQTKTSPTRSQSIGVGLGDVGLVNRRL
jgi:hypothetical protein